MGACWGKIAYPGVNPRTGAQVNRLPALTASIHAHQHYWQRDQWYALFYKGKIQMKHYWVKTKIYILCLFLSPLYRHPVLLFFCHFCLTNTWMQRLMQIRTHTHINAHILLSLLSVWHWSRGNASEVWKVWCDHREPWPLSTNYATIWPCPNLPLKTPWLEMMQKTAGCPPGHTS